MADSETRYQRVAREQRERQTAQAERDRQRQNATARRAREARRIARDGATERRYLEHLISDHNHDMSEANKAASPLGEDAMDG